MTFEEAAAVLFGGVSALHFLRKAKIQAGQKVLIYERPGVSGFSLFSWRSTSGHTSRGFAAPPI
jgi:hypothetical protein